MHQQLLIETRIIQVDLSALNAEVQCFLMKTDLLLNKAVSSVSVDDGEAATLDEVVLELLVEEYGWSEVRDMIVLSVLLQNIADNVQSFSVVH